MLTVLKFHVWVSFYLFWTLTGLSPAWWVKNVKKCKTTTNVFFEEILKSVKCVVRRIFIPQTHGDEIFYQIFIKPTKMPNKTCCIINNNNLPPFCAAARPRSPQPPARTARAVQKYFLDSQIFLSQQNGIFWDTFVILVTKLHSCV